MIARHLTRAAFLAGALLIGPLASAQTLFVSASPTGGVGDGSSWADAYVGAGGLQAALAAATPGSEVWVTAGTFLPSPTGDRFRSFLIPGADVTVRGGFVGTETSTFERPPRGTNPTILSGDLLGNDTADPATGMDNSYRILRFLGRGGMIENLELVGGGPVDPAVSRSGFAVYAQGLTGSAGVPNEFVVDGCVVRGAFGSGIFQRQPSVSPEGQVLRVIDSTFIDVDRSGVLLSTSSFARLDVDRCRFERCSTGIQVADRWSPSTKVSNTVIRNCGAGIVLDGDFTEVARGALVQGCTIVDCSLVGVTVSDLPFPGEEVLVRNSIVVGNSVDVSLFVTAEHSIAGGGVSGVGVIDVDPQFVDLSGGDLTLLPSSPAIDRGTSDGVLTGELDGARRHRAVDTPSVPNVGVGSPDFVDLGAFEFTESIGDNGDCTPEPNSTGAAGRLFAVGSAAALDNDLTLRGDQLPPGRFGIFVTGQQAGFTPMAGGLGTLCLSGPIGRFVGPGDVLQVDPAGTISFVVDLTSLPQPSTTVAVQPGDTWRFQFWHRDVPPGGGGPTSQFSGLVTLSY